MGFTGDEVIGYNSTVIEDNIIKSFLGGMCGKLESVTPGVLSPAMSVSPSTDEGELHKENAIGS